MSKQYEDSELQKDPPCSTSENNEENLTSEASENQKPEGVTRRKFVALAGTLLAATTLGTSGIMAFARNNNIDVAFPVSGGYLIVDSMRCCGCQNCMMACAMTHYGVTNPGLARIQIVGDSFQHFPYDMTFSNVINAQSLSAFRCALRELATSTKKTITCAWLTQTSALDACSVFPRALTFPLDCSGTTKISILRNATSALIRRFGNTRSDPMASAPVNRYALNAPLNSLKNSPRKQADPNMTWICEREQVGHR